MITINTVTTRQQLKVFIQFAWQIYADFPQWVPPLITDQLSYLDKKKNPFFKTSQAELFLAYKNGKTVGRIAAIRFSKHLEIYKDDRAFFGFFECLNDQEVANALLDKASQWAQTQGLTCIRGPLSFTLNDESGLLVEGYQHSPCVGMPYHPEYYQNLIVNYGFEKIEDLLAYRMESHQEIPSVVHSAAKVAFNQKDLVIRNSDFSHLDQEMEKLQILYDEAWRENWGAVPLELEEFQREMKKMKLFLNSKLIFFAEYKGKPVGVSLAVPDLNQIMKPVNGQLFPFGLFKMLFNKRRINGFRVIIMGVLKEYRLMGIDAALAIRTFEAGKQLGFTHGELSWILDSNEQAKQIVQRLGAQLYKRYRIYDKTL